VDIIHRDFGLIAIKEALMSSIDLNRFYIDFDGSPHSIPLADHPDDYSTEITGRIYFFDGNIDEEGKEVKAGEISMTHVNLSGAMDDNRNLLDVLDAHQHTYNFAHYLLNEQGSPFSDALEELLDHEILNCNFLLVDDLWLLPSYRGYNLGLLALRAAIRHCGSSVGVVGMDVYPPQCYDPTSDHGYLWNRRSLRETRSEESTHCAGTSAESVLSVWKERH
jgi:hypothetical protein